MFTKQRMMRFLFISFIVTSLFFSGLGITPVYAASMVVNTDVDETTTNGFCSLREAIANANNDAATYPDCVAGSGTDTITFAGNYTITLVDAQLPFVASEIIIKGNGAANTIIQANANPNTATYRVFQVGYYGITPGNLTLDSLTVRHGKCFGVCGGRGVSTGGAIYTDLFSTLTILNSSIYGSYARAGGGIYSEIETSLTLTNSIISGNHASEDGGGIYVGGNETASLMVTNSTISENTATYNGGGVYNPGSGIIFLNSSTLFGNFAGTGGAIYNDGILWLGNTTISGNEAYDYGGGIYSDGTARIFYSTIAFNTLLVGTNFGAGGIDGNVSLFNSIVAGNTRSITSEYRDCSGFINLHGLNLFYDVTNCTFTLNGTAQAGYFGPLEYLGPLQDNGGPTWTHALLPGSYAIDTGDNTLCADYPIYNLDQRGVTRPQGSQCDVGAFEWTAGSANVAPSDILLNASTISENLPAGTTVGTLTTMDPDAGDTHTYSFCGGADDTFFSLAGNALNTATSFDYDVQNTFHICIRSTDAGGLFMDKAFQILVQDVAENLAPETRILKLKVKRGEYTFFFTSSASDSTFLCRLDQEAFSPCQNPTSYSGLSTGLHTFQVYAIDPFGNADLTPAEYSFTVNQ